MSDQLELQIQRQTEAGFARLPPIEDLLPPEMAEAFGVEQTPAGTITLTPAPPARRIQAWMVAAAVLGVVLLISIPALLWLGGPERDTAAPPLDPPRPGMTQGPESGHFYEPVTALEALDWEEARSDAESRSFRGVPGHLVTITSEGEDLFVREAFSEELRSGPWLGGFQPVGSEEPAGGWQWVTGEPFEYTNWGDGEPNDGVDEACLQYLDEPPGWNDFPCSAGAGTIYIVEYDTDSG